MVIDPNNRLPAASSNSTRNKAATVPENDARPASAPADKVSAPEHDSVLLSPEAQALKRLEAQINASPDIDLGRVAAIKRAIAEGSFEINVERIAERMLAQDDFFS